LQDARALLKKMERYKGIDMTREEILKRQRKKGLGCVAIYTCRNITCPHCFENTCIAEKFECYNCGKRIKRTK